MFAVRKRLMRALASKAGAARLGAIAELIVDVFDSSPELRDLVARKVYQRSVQRILGAHPSVQWRVVDQSPLFTASSLSKCTIPECDICRPKRTGMAN